MPDDVLLPDTEQCRAFVRMLGSRSLVLIGMMGAGKTAIGKRAAKRLRLPFFDADHEIEVAAGQSIPEIFEEYGEAYFRSGEKRVLSRLLNHDGPQVLSTGGGAWMDKDNRQLIARHGISIWLKADFDTLMQRVRKRGNRPLLKTEDPEQTMRDLLSKRNPVYGQADITVKTENVPQGVIVDRLLSAVQATLTKEEPTKP